jgi:hypothetical protein
MNDGELPLTNFVSNGNFSSYATGWDTHQPRYYVAHMNEDGTFSSEMTNRKPFCVIDAIAMYGSAFRSDEVEKMLDAHIAERYGLAKQERSEE